ncbi:MAG: prolyl oligopeptidase family serine peptidase [Verrucomicrobia bacterium]|nr:prolyl oligopeptidase family serine peptidase [Verrucomicrobiota bacterium]
MLTHDFIPSRTGNSKYLMVVMHGLGDSLESYRPLVQELGIPEMNYLLVNAPDHYMGGYSWYDIYNNPQPGIERSIRLISELLENQSSVGFPMDQMFLFGFSQGCLMATEVGLRCPHVLGGIVGISGYVYSPETLLREMSPAAANQKLLITHGDQDNILPIQQSRHIYKTLSNAGIDIEWVEFSKAHHFAGEPEFRVIRTFVQNRMQSIQQAKK